jgi:hypothetical protein
MFTYDITPVDHFHRNIYKAVCLHLRLYCEVDVTMVANEVNKFGQIFPIHRRRKYKERRIIVCKGYSTFFSKLISESPCILINLSRFETRRYKINL